MELSYSQKMEMFEQGFVVVRGAVPKTMIDRALREINHSIGEGLPAESIKKMRSQSYCTELQRTPLFKDIVNRTPVFEYCESLLGKGNVIPAGGAQIAPRFPSIIDGPVQVSGGHIDGIYSPDNGVPPNEIHNMTMLAVVLLSDLPEINSGNFTVYPGTHHALEKYFRQHGPESILKGMPKIEYPPPVQITGKAGDVVLTHYQVVHTAGPNRSPHIRYATIYRINHKRREGKKGFTDSMLDIWKEWEGMHGLIPNYNAAKELAIASN